MNTSSLVNNVTKIKSKGKNEMKRKIEYTHTLIKANLTGINIKTKKFHIITIREFI